jgi:hypothetical protein
MIISASQYQTYAACKRKWALERLWRLPVVQDTSPAQLFGIILHAAVARWLNADDTGRDAAGNPVDPFCPGWRKCDDGELTSDEEAEEITQLVNLGIDSGILLRRPGREIERKIEMPVIRGVDMLGYIDFCLTDEAELQDHKVSKTSRYCLSEDKLVTSPQMLMYAAWMFYERHSRELEARPILVRHNQFVRQPSLRVKVVEGHIDLPAVDEFWLTLTQAAQDMLDLRSSLIGSPEYTKGDWACVDGAKDTGTCNAYGGCPFIGICGGRCSMEEYSSRVKRIKDKKDQKFDQSKEVKVGLFDRILEKKGKLPCQKQTEEEAPKAPEAPEPCKACGGKGENSKGFPCKACIKNTPAPEPAPVVETASAPEPTAALTPEVAGEVTTEVTEEVVEIVQTSPFPDPKPKIVLEPKRRGRPKGSKNTKPAEEVGPPPEVKGEFPPEPVKVPEPYLPPETRIVSAGTFPARQPEGPTLYIRCMPVGRTVNCVERSLKAAMITILKDLFKDKDPDPNDFWGLDPFRRRDMLTLAAGQVEILTDVFVAAPDSTLEMKAFVQGLRQRFENIVEGI